MVPRRPNRRDLLPGASGFVRRALAGDGGRRRLALARWRVAVLRPGEAGRAIGIKPSTLRIYAQRFAELLSDDAVGGAGGYRVFTESDVAVLRQARMLLERGFTYERAAAQLRPAASARTATQPSRRGRAARASERDELGDRLAILEQAVQAWRALAEERSHEVAALREELREARAVVAGRA